MIIKSVAIKNYRSIVECEFDLPNLLGLVGENNVGKSNLIHALELFLNKNKPKSEDDFYNRERPIEIVVNFSDLTENEKEILAAHLDGERFVVKKIYQLGEDTKTTSVKGGEETNMTPRGPQNVLANTLPELFLLPAVVNVAEQTKMTAKTYFGKFLAHVLEAYADEFDEVDTLLSQVQAKLAAQEGDAPLYKASIQLTEILREQFSQAEVKLSPRSLNRQDILKSLDVLINDGHESLVYMKGHGLQRAFVFAVMRLWADILNKQRPEQDKEKKGVLLCIEEPELHLHPHQQKIVYSMLKILTQQNVEQVQIIYTTHSSFLVHLEDYQNVGIVRKPSVEVGTTLKQQVEEIFTPGSKAEFQLLCQFDPERNELFFARKTVLVEGDTEKFSLPVIFEKLGINVHDRGISIVECGGKGNIPLFVKVLKAFDLSCYVIHDEDTPVQEYENENIKTNLSNDDNLLVLSPDFERKLELTLGSSNKPYKARKQLLDKDLGDIPENLKTFITARLGS